jgi:hypothetical protein
MAGDAPINLADFRSSADDPRHPPDPYVLTTSSKKLDGFERQAGEKGIDR